MKKKNFLYSVLSLSLIVFALLYIIPMYQDITLGEYGVFDSYEAFSIIMISITFLMSFVINLVIGVLNIRKKNVAIGVWNIVVCFMLLVNIILTIMYNKSYDDEWLYIIFSSLICQIIIYFVILILNRKIESSKIKKYSIILFCIILLVSTAFAIIPRVLLKVNVNRLVEAYNI